MWELQDTEPAVSTEEHLDSRPLRLWIYIESTQGFSTHPFGIPDKGKNQHEMTILIVIEPSGECISFFAAGIRTGYLAWMPRIAAQLGLIEEIDRKVDRMRRCELMKR